MRHVMTFPCEGETLFATLDSAAGKTGLLIVSGGNEIRIGAHRGMALLAQRLAEQGFPVFRFDRRGIGDSTGSNGGFRSSGADIAAAATAFRAEAALERLVAFGNCDGATALALFGDAAGIDRLILANPWVIEPTDDLPPAVAIRARYAEKLRNPREWLRLARGGVDFVKLFRGMSRLLRTPSQQPAVLADKFRVALQTCRTETTILLADRDNTAIAFRAALDDPALKIVTCDTDSHSFAGSGDAAWLQRQIIAVLVAKPG